MIGSALVVVGLLLLVTTVFAGLAERVDSVSVPPVLVPYLKYGARAPFVAVPLLIGGVLLADLRRLPDVIGLVLLAATVLLLVAVWIEAVVDGVTGNGRTGRAVLSGTAAGLGLVTTVIVAVVFGDVPSVLILWGFALVLLGAVSVVTGLVWAVVALLRRGDRARVGRFTGESLLVVIVGLVGIIVLAPRSPSVPDSMADAATLDDYLEDLVDSDSPPSVSVVVIADGATVYEKAFGVGDGPHGLAATPDSVYHWLSTTKVATAIATLQLVEQGLIDLDDPVDEHLPFFDPQYPSDSSPPVTIADLLNHSAGLPQNVPAVIGWLRHEDEPPLNQTEFLRDRLPSYDTLGFEPGSRGVYTNVGYYTLAAVIEQVTGERYEDYVVENVLDPLGMLNTRFEYTDAMVDNEAVGAHPMADFQTVFIPIMDLPWPASYIREHDDGWIWFERILFEGNAPTGLIGPAPEKARLLAMVLNGGELDGQRVLSERSVDTLLSGNQVAAGSSPEMDEYANYDEALHGIGWFVIRDGNRTFHDHSGGGPGFAAYMRLYAEEDHGIVILANGTNLPYLDLADAIADINW